MSKIFNNPDGRALYSVTYGTGLSDVVELVRFPNGTSDEDAKAAIAKTYVEVKAVQKLTK